MVETPFAPEWVPLSGEGRITIPQAYAEKIPWVRGDHILRVWLLELVPGRFRLLSDPQVEQAQKLREIRSAIVDGPAETEAAPTTFELNEVAALLGRLIPTTLSPPRPSWRLTIPKQIQPDDKNKRTLVLMFSLGYLEIWSFDTFTAALAHPLDSVI